jgi:multiple sugar transport system permease protein
LLIAAAAAMLFPFYWMIVTSFKTVPELSVYPPTWLPDAFQFDNYRRVLQSSSLGTYFVNSLLVAFVETLVVLIITTLTAYGLYRFHFKGKRVLFLVLLLLNALPFEVVMMFNYRVMIKMGLNDTLVALILPFCCNFFYVYIMYNAFKSIPASVYIAACLDKASDLKFLFRIALPIVRPSLVFVCIMNVVGSWNSFVWPLLITNSVETRTLPFGIYTYMTEIGSHNELVMAMSVLSQLPMIVLFIVLRKNFVNGYRSTPTASK